jgi:hypothetical protein
MEQGTTKVHYAPQTKRISVDIVFGNDVGGEGIIAKFTASREAWLEIWDKTEYDRTLFDNLTFSDIKPFLRLSGKGHLKKESVQALADLAEKSPDLFRQQFLNCVQQAHSQNPLFGPAKKARGGSPYALDWAARNKVSTLSLKLDHVLRVMRKANRSEWPDYFRKFYKTYFEKTVPEIPFKLIEFPLVIMQALSEHFNLTFGENSFETYVKKRGLTLKQLETRQCLIPQADPDLSAFFAKFIK